MNKFGGKEFLKTNKLGCALSTVMAVELFSFVELVF